MKDTAYEVEYEREWVDFGEGDSSDTEGEEMVEDDDNNFEKPRPKKKKRNRRPFGARQRKVKSKSDETTPSPNKRKLSIEDKEEDVSPTKKSKPLSVDLTGDEDEEGRQEAKPRREAKPRQSPSLGEARARAQEKVESPQTIVVQPPQYYTSTSSFYKNPPNVIMNNLKSSLGGIMYQDNAIEELFHKVYARVATPMRDMDAAQRVIPVHLTGPSGVGKTKASEGLAYGLGVGPGTPFPDFYICINMTKYHDPSHVSTITGPGAGLVGYQDPTIPARLLALIKKLKENEDRPPVIVLQLDELCKAHASIMNGLNPLLSEGRIADVKENTFVVPQDMLLIIIWTSNFGEGIADPSADTEEATRFVYRRMMDKGFDHCDIGRMGGDPIFFKPLNSTEMGCIIGKNGNTRVAMHPFSIKFGVPTYKIKRSALLDDTVDSEIDPFVRKIMEGYKSELGVRHPLEKYKAELDLLLNNASLLPGTTNADEKVHPMGIKKSRKTQDQSPAPRYWYRQIRITDQDRADGVDAFLQRNKSLVIANNQSYRNKNHFNRIFAEPTRNVIEYIVLKFHTNHTKYLAYSILKPIPMVVAAAPTNDRMSLVTSSSSTTSTSSSSSYSEMEMIEEDRADQDTMQIIKLQNEVMRTQVDTLSRDLKALRCQMDIILTTERLANEPTTKRTTFW